MEHKKPLLLPGAKLRLSIKKNKTPPPSPPAIFEDKEYTIRHFEIIEYDQIVGQARQDANIDEK